MTLGLLRGLVCWGVLLAFEGDVVAKEKGGEAGSPLPALNQMTHRRPIIGVYGVPSIGTRDPLSYVGEMEKAGVNAVFVPADEKTVRYFKDRGFEVYVSVNAFGGKEAWNRYPDSRPVKSDGSLLGSEPGDKGYGGVCPTHAEWRKKRLSSIPNLIQKVGGEGGIDGIWLDFIRYPGLWEVPDPKIPDTCYCPRCLSKFQRDTGVQMPAGLDAMGGAAWIKANAPYQWMTWKKEQITSFVSETREAIKRYQGKKALKLGLFLVPWTKGERGDAISYLLAQDPFEFARLADILSPMVYHHLCGKPPDWVGYITNYYRETAQALVWPIVEAQSAEIQAQRSKLNAEREKAYPLSVIGFQGEEKQRQELGKVLRFAGEGGADGVLVYAFKNMQSADYQSFADFDIDNIVNDSSLLIKSYEDTRTTNNESTNNELSTITLSAKDEWGEEWVAPLEKCEEGKEYVFRGELWRDGWRNGVYPAVGMWGREFLVDTHLKAGEWQPVRVNVVCPDGVKDPHFRFINRNRDATFRMRDASIERRYRFTAEPPVPVANGFFPGRFFPIGVYGAGAENLDQIKKLAVNTVLFGGQGADLKKKVEMCHKVGLRYVLAVPRDPDRVKVYLDEVAGYVRPYDMAFYVNDEPGISSFPVNRAHDINRLIKARFPACATCMAVVRPQVCGDYADTADFFMLDQYPVPFMPMTWLADCMEECAENIAQSTERKGRSAEGMGVQSSKLKAQSSKWIGGQGSKLKDGRVAPVESASLSHGIQQAKDGKGRLAAVIQAFGGERWKDVGWPRMPTEREMNCLAFLSVVNGARGIFFFTYDVIGKTEEGREALGHVVGRLNRVYPWLVEENRDTEVAVEMISENRVDPKGLPAVQCCVKQKGENGLMIAVNTIGTAVEALIRSSDDAELRRFEKRKGGHRVREVFSGKDYVIRGGKLRARFGPYEVKAFLSGPQIMQKAKNNPE